MQIDEFAKKLAGKENEAHKLAVEAIAKTVGTTTFQSMFEQQNRMAVEAVQSFIRGSQFSGLPTATITAVRKAAEQATALLCNPQIMANVDSEIRSLVSGIDRNVFAGFTNDFLKRQEQEARKVTEQLLDQIKLPQFDFQRLSEPRFDRSWTPPSILPFTPERRESATEQFVRRLQEHLDAAEKEAEQSGGTRIVKCKAPAGDEIFVTEISLRDEHFIRVAGVDQFNQLHTFTGHHSAIAITIEVVPRSEDLEDDEEESAPVN